MSALGPGRVKTQQSVKMFRSRRTMAGAKDAETRRFAPFNKLLLKQFKFDVGVSLGIG